VRNSTRLHIRRQSEELLKSLKGDITVCRGKSGCWEGGKNSQRSIPRVPGPVPLGLMRNQHKDKRAERMKNDEGPSTHEGVKPEF
jgi:hypothetical protein